MLYEHIILELQGVRLRVVGVCDSKSLLVASDVCTTELDDAILLEVCRIKSNGSSLVTLSSSGNSSAPFLFFFPYYILYVAITFGRM